MTTKITITITPDDEILAPEEMDRAMIRTLSNLASLSAMPMRKIALAIECKDEDAEQVEDRIDAILSGRPMGIEVVLKTTRERHVARRTAPAVTPIEAYLRDQPIGSDVPPLGRN